MQQDSGNDHDGAAEAAARHVLEDVKAEPVPPKIVELAQKLDGLLADKRKQAERERSS